MRLRFFCSLIGLLCAVVISVSPARGEEKIDFARDVRPILSNTCFKCHGPDAKKREAKLRLDQKADAFKARDDGPAFKPGDPKGSAAWQRITSDDPDERMPPADSKMTLTAKQIATIKKWIEQGAPYQDHWSYSRVERPAPPKVKNTAVIRRPLDTFVQARLEKIGLSLSPATKRAALIRRVSLDLTGIPPTIAEVDAFIADKSPDAYEKLVDRLLATSAYGERWARIWLDLARYADSAGYAQDPGRVIWQYRDWVIQAINRNLPFDQFTIEQLAGDMLPSASDDQIIATAFHRNTMTNSEGGTSDEEFRNAAIVDRVNTTMEVWMGLTMACAQCHTHKYDPISQEEYFRFLAVFNQTEDADRGNESPTISAVSGAQKEQKVKLQKEITRLEKAFAMAEQAAKKTKPNKQPVRSGPLKTRYVRVELSGRGVFLSLAEVQAFVGGKNIATGGKASQVSTDFAGPAKLAIDGKTNGDFNAAKSTTHTALANEPWWELDLGKSQVLEQVAVWNRTDGGVGSRLANFRVVALDEKRLPVWVQTVAASPSPSVKLSLPLTAAKLTATQKAELARYGGAASGSSPEAAAISKQIAALKKQVAAIKGGVKTPIMRELPAGKRRKTHIQIRGNYLVKDKEVTAGIPAAFHPLPKDTKEINRLVVARWLVDRENPLTARVVVNRYWEHLFGMGLVETSEDFGTQGELPSHPQLIDYLAVEFMEQGWDVKKLLKTIVTSATYRQSSKVTPERLAADPRNRLISRGPRFRLPAEMIRDQALSVSGLLSSKMYGPSVRPPRPNLGLRSAFGGSTDWKTSSGEDKFRRGLYTRWRRTTPYPSLTTFDAPSREVCTIRRIPTNTPLQAFVTLNDPVYVEAAQALARRIVAKGGTSTADRARHGFRLCIARAPQPKELERLVALYTKSLAVYKKDEAAATQLATQPLGAAPKGMNVTELAAWTVVSNVLLNLDEFLARR